METLSEINYGGERRPKDSISFHDIFSTLNENVVKQETNVISDTLRNYIINTGSIAKTPQVYKRCSSRFINSHPLNVHRAKTQNAARSVHGRVNAKTRSGHKVISASRD